MSAPAPTPPRCPVCDEIVVAYEPAVTVTADGARIHGGPPLDVVVAAVYHRDCLETPES